MEQYGNTSTFNLETVLKQNIQNADFFRNDCAKLKTWSDVVDQIYYQVDYVEPWLAGNARGPSTAFCLLFRLFELKPTEEEVRETINHDDSVYIRAVGFLYLRYVLDPRKLWGWMGPYCDDKQEIQPSGPNGATVTVGDYVRDLLLEQYYFETIFPRIPKKVEDDIAAELRRRGLPSKGKGNGGCGGPDRRGGDEGNRRPASVKASLSVAFGQRAPNRAGTKAWKEERIKAAAGEAPRGGGGGDPRSRERSRDRSREHSREPAGAAGSRGDRGERDRGDRDREWGGRERGGYGSSIRERQQERYEGREGRGDRNGRDYDYDSRRGDREQYDRSSSYGRDRPDYDHRPQDRRDGRGQYDSRRDRGEQYDRGGRDEPRRRSRSRSPYNSRGSGGGGGRDASDVFRDRAGGAAAGADARARYGDASGKVDLGPSGSSKRSADEVFRLGGSRY